MFRNFLSKNKFSTKVVMPPEAPQKYNAAMTFFHWGMGGAILACLGLVQYKQSLPFTTEEEKAKVGKLMGYHKSFGLVVSGLMLPRLLNKMVSKHPAGPSVSILRYLSKLSHWGMYGLVTSLCVSGISMGYHNTYGVAFFNTGLKTPALKEANGPAAGWWFKIHKYSGVALEYAVALHIAGFTFHFLTGQNLLKRLSGPGIGSIMLAAPWIGVAGAVAYSTKPTKLPEFKNWYQPPPMGELPKKIAE